MIKDEIKLTLSQAMKEKRKEEVATCRLILAAIKDQEIALRSSEGPSDDDLSDDAVIKLLDGMIKQRRQSIEMFQQGGREELAQKETDEIKIIQTFLPRQLSGQEVEEAVASCIKECSASSLKDMRLVMDCLKAKYSGQLDLGKTAGAVKAMLG